MGAKRSKYSKEQLEMIKQFILRYNYPRKEELCELVDQEKFYGDYYNLFCQIFSKLQLFDKKDDPYEIMLGYIMKYFEINVSVLDFCSGHYPVLAEKIAQEQKKNNIILSQGSIDVYDMAVVTDKINGINIHRQFINSSINMSNYKLVVAQKPAFMYDQIIELACKNRKDFIINPSECMLDLFRFYDIACTFYDGDVDQNILGNVLLHEIICNYGKNSFDVIDSFYDYNIGSIVYGKFKK